MALQATCATPKVRQTGLVILSLTRCPSPPPSAALGAHFLTNRGNHFYTLLASSAHRCRAAICHPGTGRGHPADCLPHTAVMASGSPRKISNRQKAKKKKKGVDEWGGMHEGQRAEIPLISRTPLPQPSSPFIASPHFGPVTLRDTSANK